MHARTTYRSLVTCVLVLTLANLARSQVLDLGSLITGLMDRNKPVDRFCNENQQVEDIVRDIQASDRGCLPQLRYLHRERRKQIGERLRFCACDKKINQDDQEAIVGSLTGLFTGNSDMSNLIPSLTMSCQDKVDRILCRLVNETRPKEYCNICSFIKLSMHHQDILDCTCALHEGPLTEGSLGGTMYNCLERYPLRVSEARELGALDNGMRCKTVRDEEWL